MSGIINKMDKLACAPCVVVVNSLGNLILRIYLRAFGPWLLEG